MTAVQAVALHFVCAREVKGGRGRRTNLVSQLFVLESFEIVGIVRRLAQHGWFLATEHYISPSSR